MLLASRRRLRAEVLIVLGLSLGQSAVYSIVQLLDKLTRAPLSEATSTLNRSQSTREYFDLTYQLLDIFFALVPVALVFYFLSQHAAAGSASPFARLGFNLARPGKDLLHGVGLAALIGIPSLGLYAAGRALGITTAILPSGLDAYWWTVPVLVLSEVRLEHTTGNTGQRRTAGQLPPVPRLWAVHWQRGHGVGLCLALHEDQAGHAAGHCACIAGHRGVRRLQPLRQGNRPRLTRLGDRRLNVFGRHPWVTSLAPADGGRSLSGVCQMVTAPEAVSKVTDMMPGVPWGAIHCTATSSSGFSTGSPSHSVTRSAEPAMVRLDILTSLS